MTSYRVGAQYKALHNKVVIIEKHLKGRENQLLTGIANSQLSICGL